MRISLPVVLAAVVLSLALSSAPAFAQEIRVSVPFAFSVSGQIVPAGVYTFEVRSSAMIKMRSVASPSIGFELPVLSRLDDNAGADSKLVFEKEGDTQVLSEIWTSDQDGYVIEWVRSEEGPPSTKAPRS
jgi:hypothetical protein